MKLLHPEFLFALAILAIPIIVHLFNFRRFKKVIFPNLRFLEQVDTKTQSRNRLKHLLVLLSRLLALACLVIAFCQPYFSSSEKKASTAEQRVAIYLDNSYSMSQDSESGQLLSRGIDLAAKIIDSYGRDGRFTLFTNDLKSEHQIWMSKEEILTQLHGVNISPAQRSMSDIMARMNDQVLEQKDSDGQLYLISDFQKGAFDPINMRLDSSLSAYILGMEQEGQGNLFIDSIWFESPIRSLHQPERLGVRVTNSSAKEQYDIPIDLRIDGQQKAIGNMSIRPYSTVDSILSFTNSTRGWKQGVVRLNDHPVDFDDALHFSYPVHENCQVMILSDGEEGLAIAKIFQKDPYYLTSESKTAMVDISSIANQDLIVLAGPEKISSGLVSSIQDAVSKGASLCIIPGIKSDIESLNEMLLSLQMPGLSSWSENPQKVSQMDLEHPLFEGVFESIPKNMDLPSVGRYLKAQETGQNRYERIMQLQDRSPFLVSKEHEKGRCYLFYSGIDPSLSDLSRHSIFVTSILRMAENSLRSPLLYHTIGSDRAIALNLAERQAEDVLKMNATNSEFEFIPEQRALGNETWIRDRGQVLNAGTFELKGHSEVYALLSYNHDRRESIMDFYRLDEVQELIDSEADGRIQVLNASSFERDSSDISALDQKQFWRHFLLLALLFFLFEILLIRYWK